MLKSWIAGLIILKDGWFSIEKINVIAMNLWFMYVFFEIELNTTVTHLYIDINSRINPFQIEELRGCPAFEVL